MRVAINRKGLIRVRDRRGEVILESAHPIRTRRWQRIEWAVDHEAGVVEIKIFTDADASMPTEVVRSRAGRRVGPAVDAVQIGASGATHFSSVFWTDDPGLSHSSYLGAVQL